MYIRTPELVAEPIERGEVVEFVGRSGARDDLETCSALSEVILSEIHGAFGENAQVSTARIGRPLTGFVLLVPRGTRWYAHRAGFDYGANGGVPVYFDVTYNRPLELAGAHGVSAIHYKADGCTRIASSIGNPVPPWWHRCRY